MCYSITSQPRTMTTIVDTPIDYTDRKAIHGGNRFSRITPISGASTGTVTLTGTAPTDVTWEIPANVFNLSRSYLQFTAIIPLQTGSTSTVFLHSLPFERVTLMTRSGVSLVDIPNFWNYFLTTDVTCRPLKDYIESDVANGAVATRSVCGACPTSFSDLATLSTKASASGVLQQVRYMIPLWRINQSLFALDKNLYFGEILTFRVSFAGSDKFCYKTTGNLTSETAVTITNPYLQLSIETNNDIRAQVMDMCNNGYSFKTPFPYSFRFVNAGTSYSTNIRLNSGHGKKLLRVYTACPNTLETLSAAQTSVIPTDIRTLVDQSFVQDYSLTTASNDDYLWMKDMLAGSALYNDSARNVVTNGWWSYVDNFAKHKPLDRMDDVEDGLDLTMEKMYSGQLTVAACSIYHFVIAQRTISIQRGVIQIQ